METCSIQSLVGDSELCESKNGDEFTKSGKCYDEITFIFDDGNKLYVSQNFLHYVSPLFQAMFENDSEEKETRTAKCPGKSFDDFLEFLLCLHPNKQKPVDNTNVLRIAAIADEYQSALIMKKCKEVMIDWISTSEQKHNDSSFEEVARAAHSCLLILIEAESLHYESIVTSAVSSIASFGYKWFTGTPTSDEAKMSKSIEDILLDCKSLYDSLSDKLKVNILLQRLKQCDSHSAYHYKLI